MQSSGHKALTGATAHWWILKDEPALSQTRLPGIGWSHGGPLRRQLYES